MAWPKGSERRDAISAVILIGLGVLGLVEALSFPARAAAWPMWMFGLLIAFSLLLLIRSLRGGGGAGRGAR